MLFGKITGANRFQIQDFLIKRGVITGRYFLNWLIANTRMSENISLTD